MVDRDELKLEVGAIYEAKKPKAIGWPPLINDRVILWIGLLELQYDGPAVARGRHFPKVTHEQFRKWAGRDITGLGLLKEGEWRVP